MSRAGPTSSAIARLSPRTLFTLHLLERTVAGQPWAGGRIVRPPARPGAGQEPARSACTMDMNCWALTLPLTSGAALVWLVVVALALKSASNHRTVCPVWAIVAWTDCASGDSPVTGVLTRKPEITDWCFSTALP